MEQPTRIVVLPSGTTIVMVPSERQAEDWRQALFGTWQDEKGNRTIIAVESRDVVITDLRR